MSPVKQQQCPAEQLWGTPVFAGQCHSQLSESPRARPVSASTARSGTGATFFPLTAFFGGGVKLGMQLQNISEEHLPPNIALSREKLPLSLRWLQGGGAWAWEIGIHKSGTIPLLFPSASSFSYNKGINSFAGLSISEGQRQTSEQWICDAAGFTKCIKNIIRLKSSLHWRNLFYLNTEFYLAFIVLNGFIIKKVKVKWKMINYFHREDSSCGRM